ncbi:MAG: TonB-dependent receptor [Flavobacteriaceae bacterium]|nr:TonB-dependent receptor [Flavobacteriaceae bacterium]
MYKNIFLTFSLFILGISYSVAQNKSIDIKGKVVESANKISIEFATILILDKTTNEAIAGTVADIDGEFELKYYKDNDFYIKVSFIGFKDKLIKKFKITDNKLDIGIIILSEDESVLAEVTVRAEKSQTVFKLDKRVFNVGKDLSSTGSSALEILDNVPSVDVNIEGVISLRGSTGVQILINGKPSVVASSNALGSITADMIERIEVITNPSAKYDAEGSSGIINIIIKKSEKRGTNGSVTINTGIPKNHSIGFSLNRRTEKFNLFSQFGYGKRVFPKEFESRNTDISNGTTLYNIGKSDKNEDFYNVILGLDYHINDLNMITLSGNYTFENEKEYSNQIYSLSSNDVLTDTWSRNEETEATNPKWQSELQYKKDFKDNKDHNLLISALGTSFGKDKESLFENTTSIGNKPNTSQKVYTELEQEKYTFKIDYIRPFSEKYILEIGSQYVVNTIYNDYSISDLNNEIWSVNENYSNILDYSQGVLGMYTTGTYEGDKWGIKMGLRLEKTDLKAKLINTNTENNQKYTNLFPSVHTSYKINNDISFQAGYSKRIFRPRSWDLNPFFSFRDNFNIRTGNPNLEPEFTDSYEFTSIYKLNKLSLNFGLYHRYTKDVIERVISFENNISTSSPQNIGTNNTTGLELNAKYSPFNWFSITMDINYNTYMRKGEFEDMIFDFSAERWSLKTKGKFSLPAKITMEITGNYRSEYKTIQQTISDNFFMNLGLRKKIMKGKMNVSLSVRDIFETRKRESITDQIDFYNTATSQRGRFVTLGVSFGFGKGDAMEFSSGRNRF